MAKKADRSHKSKAEQRRLARKSKVKMIGNGFRQRTAKPEVTGEKKRSMLVRVDANFARWLRHMAKTHGAVTTVTRRLHQHKAVLATLIEPKPGEIEV